MAGRHQLGRALLALLAILWTVVPSVAADGRAEGLSGAFSVHVWRAEDGLPQNTVHALVQSRDGYLWIGTEEGLARFDGMRFVVFDKSNTPALADNFITALLEGPDGSLWIGTRGGGLSRLRNGAFVTYSRSDGLPSAWVRALTTTADGAIWIGTSSGLARFVHDTFTTFTTQHGLTSNGVRALHVARDGTLWIGTTNGVTRRRSGTFEAVRSDTKLPPGLTAATVRAIVEDRAGVIWAGSEGNGLFKIDRGHVTRHGTHDGLASDAVRALAIDRHDRLWVGFDGQGISLGAPGTRLQPLSALLDSGLVRCLKEDREGNIWVGLEGGGLARLRPSRVTSFTVRDGLSHDFIRAIREDASGRVWVGTEGAGLNWWDGRRFQRLGSQDRLLADQVTSLAEDRQGRLWVGTEGGGLNVLVNGRVTASYSVGDGVPNRSVWAVIADRAGGIWVGTGSGIARFDGARFKAFSTRDGLPATFATSLFEASTGDIWVGFRASGVARFDGQRFFSYGEREGLPHSDVNAFHEDDAGRMWLATDRGLFRFERERFSGLTVRDGLFHDNLYAIVDDGLGRFWFSSPRGIFGVDRQALERRLAGGPPVVALSLTAADGMPSTECSGDAQPAGWRSQDGSLWFATIKGVVRLNPKQLALNPVAPSVVIEEIVVNGATLPKPDSAHRLPPRTTHLGFRYTALSFVAPEKVRFRYRLEGFDEDWVEASERREAFYTSLPPGRYTFRVTASNDDGIWSTTGASVPIEIAPPFYLTWWFYAAAALVLATSVMGGHRLRVRKIRRKFATVLNERSRIAREMHDTLLQGFAGATLQLQALAGQLPADERASLERVLGQMDESLAGARRAIHDLRAGDADRGTLVTALAERLSRLTSGTGVDVRLELFGVPRRVARTIEHELVCIGQEAVTNALRYSRADRIAVDVRFDAESVSLRVEDDGCGISPGATNAGEHYGIVGMRERAALLGGTLQIDSRPGAGTRVLARVPLAAGVQASG